MKVEVVVVDEVEIVVELQVEVYLVEARAPTNIFNLSLNLSECFSNLSLSCSVNFSFVPIPVF